MKKGILLAFACLSLSFSTSFACTEDGTEGILPENKLNIPVGAKNTSQVTEEIFNQVLDRVEALYAPIVESLGKKLLVVRNWDDGTVNAYAQQQGDSWMISMFGGLARHHTITPDAFAVVACHELGHHLGGAPKKKTWFSTSWASNEGQSDYFATMKCLRKYMEKDANAEIMAKVEVPTTVIQKCSESFQSQNDRAMCQRGAMAGLSLGNLFKVLRNSEAELNFDTPDPSIVRKTDHNHPASQCRLDTYFAGALCDKDYYSDVDNEDAAMGVCTRAEGYKFGTRPRCWYKVPRNL